jgi:hypothetical protein
MHHSILHPFPFQQIVDFNIRFGMLVRVCQFLIELAGHVFLSEAARLWLDPSICRCKSKDCPISAVGECHDPDIDHLAALLQTISENSLKHPVYHLQGGLPRIWSKHGTATADMIWSYIRTHGEDLPNDYKAFLQLSDGLAPVWDHNYHRHNFSLGSIRRLKYGYDVSLCEHFDHDILLGPLPCTRRIFNGIKRDVHKQEHSWPALGSAFVIGNTPSEGPLVALIRPRTTKRVAEAYLRLLQSDKVYENVKQSFRQRIEAGYGSIEWLHEASKGETWLLVTVQYGECEVFLSFTDFLESLARRSKEDKNDNDSDRSRSVYRSFDTR